MYLISLKLENFTDKIQVRVRIAEGSKVVL